MKNKRIFLERMSWEQLVQIAAALGIVWPQRYQGFEQYKKKLIEEILSMSTILRFLLSEEECLKDIVREKEK